MAVIFTAEQMAQIATALNAKINAADTKATNAATAAAAADAKAVAADTKATNAATAAAEAGTKATNALETANGKQAQLYLHHININGDGNFCGGKITLINRSATRINTFELFKNSLNGIVNLSLVDETDAGYYMLSYTDIQIDTDVVRFKNAVCLDADSMAIGAHVMTYDNQSTYSDVVETL